MNGYDSNSELYVIALAFEHFYNEPLVVRKQIGEIRQEYACPKLRKFVTYLTGIDPNFPSWEYSYSGFYAVTQVVHPAFKKKMARYYEEWKKFKGSAEPASCVE
jgi:hypothetical protein